MKIQAQNQKGDDITKRTGRFKGRVLMMKMGYNPNSSSIGTVVYSFPYAFIAVSAALAVLAALLIKKTSKEKK